MAFMYLGEREPKQDMASMLAQAGATGLGVFNQLQYQKDQPEYKLAQERLKNMQLVQQAIAALSPEFQSQAYTGIDATATGSPEFAAAQGLKREAFNAPQGGLEWQKRTGDIARNAAEMGVIGSQKTALDFGNELNAATREEQRQIKGPLAVQAMTDESGYKRAATGLTQAQTTDIPLHAADRKTTAQAAMVGAKAHGLQAAAAMSQAQSEVTKVGLLGQHYTNEAAKLRIQEGRDLTKQDQDFAKIMNEDEKNMAILARERGKIKKEYTGAEQKLQLSINDSASIGILQTRQANLGLEKGIDPKVKLDHMKSIANGYLTIAKSQAAGAMASLASEDFAGYYADVSSYKSTLSNLEGLATTIPSVKDAIKTMEDSFNKVKAEAASKSLLRDSTGNMIWKGGSIFSDPVQARIKALDEGLYNPKR